MRVTFLALALCSLFAVASPVRAQTLPEALVSAYTHNPALMAERARLRAADEKVSEALSGYRPSVEAVGGIGRSSQYAASMGTETLSPRDVGLNIKQPLFRGFRTQASVEAAEADVKAGRAALENAEQELLYQAAKAYLNVIRSQKIFALTRHNEEILHTNLASTQEHFKVGEVTKTDISQSESRLSAAAARRIKAEGDLANDRATYFRVIGAQSGALEQPTFPFDDSQKLHDIVETSIAKNPAVIASSFARDSAKANVSFIKGNLLPEVSLVGSLSHAADQSLMLPDRQSDATIMARVTIPLYNAGSDYAKTRAAQETASQRRYEMEDVRNKVRELAIRAWQSLLTARAAIRATTSQKTAAELALHGVREERKAGTRTILDVLNAEQEALSANVDLVQAQHDETLAILQIKAALGKLTARALDLKTDLYDPTLHYDNVRGKWFGTSVE